MQPSACFPDLTYGPVFHALPRAFHDSCFPHAPSRTPVPLVVRLAALHGVAVLSLTEGRTPMHNAAFRDGVAEQFRDAADAVQALAIREDEEMRDPARSFRSRVSRGRDLATHCPAENSTPVPGLPSGHRGTAMTGEWPLRDFIELGALSSAVPCARLHARQLMWEWGNSTYWAERERRDSRSGASH
jgi:hypothetical protein